MLLVKLCIPNSQAGTGTPTRLGLRNHLCGPLKWAVWTKLGPIYEGRTVCHHVMPPALNVRWFIYTLRPHNSDSLVPASVGPYAIYVGHSKSKTIVVCVFVA